ncbi:MAG: Ig-like domain-containing protein [Reichenbachiella sp.]
MTIFDTDDDGYIDQIDLTFDENIITDDGAAVDIDDFGTLTLPDGSLFNNRLVLGVGRNTGPPLTVVGGDGSSPVVSLQAIPVVDYNSEAPNTGKGSTDIELPGTLWEDVAGNALAAVTAPDFVTATDVIDSAKPVLVSSTPSDGSISASDTDNFIFEFSENVVVGTGLIDLHEISPATGSIQTFDVTNGGQISFSGTTVVSTLGLLPLSLLNEYAVRIPGTAVSDGLGNFYLGIADDLGLNFVVNNIKPDNCGFDFTINHGSGNDNGNLSESDCNNEPASISSTNTSELGAASLFFFNVYNGNTQHENMSAITILNGNTDIDWREVIAGAQLIDENGDIPTNNSNVEISPTINAASLVWTSIDNDNGGNDWGDLEGNDTYPNGTEFALRVWFKTDLGPEAIDIDGKSLIFELDRSDLSGVDRVEDAAGTGWEATNTPISSGPIVFNVETSEYQFLVEPVDTERTQTMTTVTLEATDAYGSRDVHYAGPDAAFEITTTGVGLVGSPGLATNFTAGVATVDPIVFNWVNHTPITLGGTGAWPVNVASATFLIDDTVDPNFDVAFGAKYVDGNGDGTIDQVVLKMDEPIDYTTGDENDFTFTGTGVGTLGAAIDATTANNGIDLTDEDEYVTMSITGFSNGTYLGDANLEYIGGTTDLQDFGPNSAVVPVGLTDIDIALPAIVNPTSTDLTPADGATAATAVDFLKIVFSEDVVAVGGNLILRDGGDLSIVETISVTNITKTTVDGNEVTFQLNEILEKGNSYFITLAAGAFEDLNGNAHPGLLGVGSWSFTIQDLNPAIALTSPSHNEIDISRTEDITFTFDEAVNYDTDFDIVLVGVDGGSGDGFTPAENLVYVGGNGTNELTFTHTKLVEKEVITVTVPEDAFVAVDNGAILDVTNSPIVSAGNYVFNFTIINVDDEFDPEVLTADLGTDDVSENFDVFDDTDLPTSLGNTTGANTDWTSLGVVEAGSAEALAPSDTPAGDAAVIVASGGNHLTSPTVTAATSVSFAYRTLVDNGSAADVIINIGTTNDVIGSISSINSGEWQLFSYDFGTGTPYTGEIRIAYTSGGQNMVIDDFRTDDGYYPYNDLATVDFVPLGIGEFKVKFNEPVFKGSGNIRLFANTDPDIELLNVDVNSGFVSIDDNVLTVDISSIGANLPGNVQYYVQIGASAIQDASGNQFAGIPVETWYFKTRKELVPPQISSTQRQPLDNETNVETDVVIGAQFNEPIKYQTVGVAGQYMVTLYLSSSGEVVEEFDVLTDIDPDPTDDTYPDGTLTVSGRTLRLNTTEDLSGLTGYNVRIDAGALLDFSDNEFAGLLTSNAWNFTTGAETVITFPEIDPLASNFFVPAHDPGNKVVSITPTISFTMTEPVNGYDGQDIIIYDKTNMENHMLINATDFSIDYLGKTVEINNVELEYNTTYYIEIPAGALEDNSGNLTQVPIGGDGVWEFTTILDQTAPEIVSVLPDISLGYPTVDNRTFTMEFNEPVQFNSGTINLYYTDADANPVATLNVPAEIVNINEIVENFDSGLSGADGTDDATLLYGDWTRLDGKAAGAANAVGATGDAVVLENVGDHITSPFIYGVSTINFDYRTETGGGNSATFQVWGSSDGGTTFDIDYGQYESTETDYSESYEYELSSLYDGQIRIEKVSDNGGDNFYLDNFSVSSHTISFEFDLPSGGTSYYVTVSDEAVSDVTTDVNNDFAGYAATPISSRWWFTTDDDSTNPSLLSASIVPADDAVTPVVPIDISNDAEDDIVLTFDELVVPVDDKFLRIYYLDNDHLADSIDVDLASPVVVGGNTTFTYDMTDLLGYELSGGTEYYIVLEADAFVDEDSSPLGNAAFGDNTTWNFITTGDDEVPLANTTIPDDDLLGSDYLATNLIIEFSERVVPSTGSIQLVVTNTGDVVEDLLASAVTIDNAYQHTSGPDDLGHLYGSRVSIPVTLSGNTGYHVLIDGDAFLDASGNAYAGIANTVGWNFNTAGEPNAPENDPKILSLTPASTNYNVTYTGLTGTFSTGETVIASDGGFGEVVSDIGTSMVVRFTHDIANFSGSLANEAADANATTITGVTQLTHGQFNIQDDIEIVFSEPVIVTAGTITIENSDASRSQVIALNDGARVTGAGTNTLTINPDEDFDANNEIHRITVTVDALRDGSFNFFDGVLTGDWEFSTDAGVVVTPTAAVDACIGQEAVLIPDFMITETNFTDFAISGGLVTYKIGLTGDYYFDDNATAVATEAALSGGAGDFTMAGIDVTYEDLISGDFYSTVVLTFEIDDDVSQDEITVSGLEVGTFGSDVIAMPDAMYRTGGTAVMYGNEAYHKQAHINMQSEIVLPPSVGITNLNVCEDDAWTDVGNGFGDIDITITASESILWYEDDQVSQFVPGVGTAISPLLEDFTNNGMVISQSEGTLNYNSESGSFSVGSTVTGDVSGATGEIVSDNGVKLELTNVDGYFRDDEGFTESINGTETASVTNYNASSIGRSVYVSQIDAGGCESQMVEVIVTVNPSPDAEDLAGLDFDDDLDILSSGDNVCSFENITLGKAGNTLLSGYQWDWTGTNAADVANPNINAIQNPDNIAPFSLYNDAYTLDVVDNFGCESTVTGNMNVRVDPRLEVSINSVNGLVFTDNDSNGKLLEGLDNIGSVTGLFSGTALGTFDYVSNPATAEFKPSTAGSGTYPITFTVTDNTTTCSDEATINIIVNEAVDIFTNAPQVTQCEVGQDVSLVLNTMGVAGGQFVYEVLATAAVNGNTVYVTGSVIDGTPGLDHDGNLVTPDPYSADETTWDLDPDEAFAFNGGTVNYSPIGGTFNRGELVTGDNGSGFISWDESDVLHLYNVTGFFGATDNLSGAGGATATVTSSNIGAIDRESDGTVDILLQRRVAEDNVGVPINFTVLGTKSFTVFPLPDFEITSVPTYVCEDDDNITITGTINDVAGKTINDYRIEKFVAAAWTQQGANPYVNDDGMTLVNDNVLTISKIFADFGLGQYRVIASSIPADDPVAGSPQCTNESIVEFEILSKPSEPFLVDNADSGDDDIFDGIGVKTGTTYQFEYCSGATLNDLVAVSTGVDDDGQLFRWYNDIGLSSRITAGLSSVETTPKDEILSVETLFGIDNPMNTNVVLTKTVYLTEINHEDINSSGYSGCESEPTAITILLYPTTESPTLSNGVEFSAGNYVFEYCAAPMGSATMTNVDLVNSLDTQNNSFDPNDDESLETYFTFYADDAMNPGTPDYSTTLFVSTNTSFDPTLVNGSEGFGFAGNASTSITVHVTQTNKDNSFDGSYALNEFEGCESPSTSITINVNTTPDAPAITDFGGDYSDAMSTYVEYYVCEGDDIEQIETPSESGAIYEWATDNTMGSEVFVDQVGGSDDFIDAFNNRLVTSTELRDNFGYDETVPGTYTYYVRQYTDANEAAGFLGCPSDWTTVVIEVYEDPTGLNFTANTQDLDAGADMELSVCEGDLSSVSVQINGNVGEYNWYIAQSDRTISDPVPVFSSEVGVSMSVATGEDLRLLTAVQSGGLDMDGNFYFLVSQVNNIAPNGSEYMGCESELGDMAFMTVHVWDIPLKPIIENSYAEFVINDPGTPLIVGETITGDDSGATADVVSHTGTALHVENISGVFEIGEDFTASQNSTINSIPTINNDFYYCSVDNDAVQDLEVHGEPGVTFRWYSDAELTSELTSAGVNGNTLTPVNAGLNGMPASGDYTFYVTQTQDINLPFVGCESPYTEVTVHILTNPNAPDLNSDATLSISEELCDNGGASAIPEITVLNPAGGLYNWYRDVNEDGLLDGGDIARDFEETSGAYTPLYANMNVNDNNRDGFNDDNNFYLVQQVTNQGVNSSTFEGCPSVYTAFDITIHDIPASPRADGNGGLDTYVYCTDDPGLSTLTIQNAADYIGADVSYNWYSTSSAGLLSNEIFSGDGGLTINANDHASYPTVDRDENNTYSYFVTATEDGCSTNEFTLDASREVTLEFQPLPDLNMEYGESIGENSTTDDFENTYVCYDQGVFEIQGEANGDNTITSGTFAIYASETDAMTDADNNDTASALTLNGFDGDDNDGRASFDPALIAKSYSDLINDPDLGETEVSEGKPVTFYVNFYYTDGVSCDDVITQRITVQPKPTLDVVYINESGSNLAGASLEGTTVCYDEGVFNIRGNQISGDADATSNATVGELRLYANYDGMTLSDEITTGFVANNSDNGDGTFGNGQASFDPMAISEANVANSGGREGIPWTYYVEFIYYDLSTDNYNCTNSVIREITIHPQPTLNIEYLTVAGENVIGEDFGNTLVCYDESSFTLQATHISGADAIDDAASGIFELYTDPGYAPASKLTTSGFVDNGDGTVEITAKEVSDSNGEERDGVPVTYYVRYTYDDETIDYSCQNVFETSFTIQPQPTLDIAYNAAAGENIGGEYINGSQVCYDADPFVIRGTHISGAAMDTTHALTGTFEIYLNQIDADNETNPLMTAGFDGTSDDGRATFDPTQISIDNSVDREGQPVTYYIRYDYEDLDAGNFACTNYVVRELIIYPQPTLDIVYINESGANLAGESIDGTTVCYDEGTFNIRGTHISGDADAASNAIVGELRLYANYIGMTLSDEITTGFVANTNDNGDGTFGNGQASFNPMAISEANVANSGGREGIPWTYYLEFVYYDLSTSNYNCTNSVIREITIHPQPTLNIEYADAAGENVIGDDLSSTQVCYDESSFTLQATHISGADGIANAASGEFLLFTDAGYSPASQMTTSGFVDNGDGTVEIIASEISDSNDEPRDGVPVTYYVRYTYDDETLDYSCQNIYETSFTIQPQPTIDIIYDLDAGENDGGEYISGTQVCYDASPFILRGTHISGMASDTTHAVTGTFEIYLSQSDADNESSPLDTPGFDGTSDNGSATFDPAQISMSNGIDQEGLPVTYYIRYDYVDLDAGNFACTNYVVREITIYPQPTLEIVYNANSGVNLTGDVIESTQFCHDEPTFEIIGTQISGFNTEASSASNGIFRLYSDAGLTNEITIGIVSSKADNFNGTLGNGTATLNAAAISNANAANTAGREGIPWTYYLEFTYNNAVNVPGGDAYNCETTIVRSFTIQPEPTVSIVYDSDTGGNLEDALVDGSAVCYDESAFNFKAVQEGVLAETADGAISWSVNTGGLTPTDGIASFNPPQAAFAAGVLDELAGNTTHDVTFVFTDLNGCDNEDTATIEVTKLPTLSIVVPEGDDGGFGFCSDAAAISLVAQEDGIDVPNWDTLLDSFVISSVATTGLTDGGDGTASFVAGTAHTDPAVDLPLVAVDDDIYKSTHVITLTYTNTTQNAACTNSVTTEILVNPIPELQIFSDVLTLFDDENTTVFTEDVDAIEVCENEGDFKVKGDRGSTDAGLGTFYINGVDLNTAYLGGFNDDATFRPRTLADSITTGSFEFTLTYDFTNDDEGCYNSLDKTVEVHVLPEVAAIVGKGCVNPQVEFDIRLLQDDPEAVGADEPDRVSPFALSELDYEWHFFNTTNGELNEGSPFADDTGLSEKGISGEAVGAGGTIEHDFAIDGDQGNFAWRLYAKTRIIDISTGEGGCVNEPQNEVPFTQSDILIRIDPDITMAWEQETVGLETSFYFNELLLEKNRVDSIAVLDRTTGEVIIDHVWDPENDNGADIPLVSWQGTEVFGGDDFKVTFDQPGLHDLRVEMRNTSGCVDSLFRNVNVLPVITVDQAGYTETFDLSDGFSPDDNGWYAETLKRDAINISSAEGSLEAFRSSSWTWAQLNLNADSVRLDVMDSVKNTVKSDVWGWATLNAPGTYLDNNGEEYTTTSYHYIRGENSWLYSPTFDLSAMEQPMISFSRAFNFSAVREGAVVQYSMDDGLTWLGLGKYDDDIELASGLSWYNDASIPRDPGEQTEIWNEGANAATGWSGGADEELLISWEVARHKLDIDAIPEANRNHLRFRFAISVQDELQPDGRGFFGFAFDDFEIIERSKNVLIENFYSASNDANNFNSLTTSLDNSLNVIINDPNISNGDEVIITYHPDFGVEDPFNNINPTDPGARTAFYSINQVSSVIDGSSGSNTDAALGELSWTQDDLILNSLKEPRVLIEAEEAVDAEAHELNGRVRIRVNDRFDVNEELLVYVAVIEEDVVLENPLNDFSSHSNLLRKLLPDASGHYIKLDTEIDFDPNSGVLQYLPLGESDEWLDVQWDLANIQDDAELAVVIFVQDNNTKEIYQSVKYSAKDGSLIVDAKNTADDGTGNPITGIDELANMDYTMYPNPSNDRVTIKFNDNVGENLEWVIFDQAGRLYNQGVMNAGVDRFEMSTNDFPNGMYYMSIKGESHEFRYKKLMVFHK